MSSGIDHKSCVIIGDESKTRVKDNRHHHYREKKAMSTINLDPREFKALDANPGGTLERFSKCVE